MRYCIYASLATLVIFYSCKNESKVVVNQNPENSESLKLRSIAYEVSKPGDTLDMLNNVFVFYNENMNNTSGRNLTKDGYNLGLKWQCVEFVKRYYFEHLKHKMPNSYGHAKDFYNVNLKDGKLNRDRDLLQFSNGSKQKPKADDLIVFKGNVFNPYGHVAIVSKVTGSEMEIVQQNVGKTSRETFVLKFKNNLWYVNQSSILGWLRKE